jgi:hypothetical protein
VSLRALPGYATLDAMPFTLARDEDVCVGICSS